MSASKKKVVPQFFWEKKAKLKNKFRFNLLLLEYGEYFLEDLSVYFFPVPTNDLSQSFVVQDGLKIQGRLKISSRSLIFEPADLRHPIVKFPYKSMTTPLQVFNMKQTELDQMSIEATGFFTFLCTSYFEMKANDKVGPYKLVEWSSGNSLAPGQLKGHRIVFALVHSDLSSFMVKVEQFRNIFTVSERQGAGMGQQLLKPFIDNALLTNFDTSSLVDFHEKLLLRSPVSVKKIRPLIVNPGILMVTESRVYFQPSSLNNVGDSILVFELRKVARVHARRYLLRQTGMEFVLLDGSSFLFCFETRFARDEIYELIMQQPVVLRNQQSSVLSPLAAMQKWQRKEMSNFEYLMYLNSEADRSSNDLTQYPVFPQIIADYKSPKLDLKKASTFRDLTKPMGALNPDRLNNFLERYHSMPPGDPALGMPPPFMYGTHYSTPGYVLHYLVRVAPEHMLCLQNGKFDAPDRMFHSVGGSFSSCVNNPADLKELIPEFFCGNGEFLMNLDDLDLGHRHTGERLADVELPAWADSPRDFIRKHAKALECDYVSERLHHWIDLIFGYKQQGPAAVEACNLFYYLTYEGAVDLEAIKNETERNALQIQIEEFGQTPKQLFKYAHPARSDFGGAIGAFTGDVADTVSSASAPTTDDIEESFGSVGMGGIKGSSSNGSLTGLSGGVHPFSPPDSAQKNNNSHGNVRGRTRTSSREERILSQDRMEALMNGTAAPADVIGEEVLDSQLDNDIAVVRLSDDFSQEVQRELDHRRRSTPKTAADGYSSKHSEQTNKATEGSEDPPTEERPLSPFRRVSNFIEERRASSPMPFFRSPSSSTSTTPAAATSTSGAGTTTVSSPVMAYASSPTTAAAAAAAATSSGSSSSSSSSGTVRLDDGSTASAPASAAGGAAGGGGGVLSSVMSLWSGKAASLVDKTFGSQLSKTASPQQTPVDATGINISQKRGNVTTPGSTATNAAPMHDSINTGAAPMPPSRGGASLQQQPSSRPPPPAAAAAALSSSGVGGAASSSASSGALPGDPAHAYLRSTLNEFRWHGAAPVSALSVCVSVTSNAQAQGTMDEQFNSNTTFSAVVASVARDSFLKVTHVVQQPTKATSLKQQQQQPLQLTASTRRSYSPGESPSTAVCMTRDGNRVLIGSWDNNIHSYSIVNACPLGVTLAHGDGITCLSLDASDRLLLSGSLDASVKVWSVRGVGTGGSGTGAGGAINPSPVAEFYDHESAISAAAMHDSGGFAAAGAEDGFLVVWNLSSLSPLFSRVVTTNKRAVTCLAWLPQQSCNFYYGYRGFSAEKLVCGTADGKLLCLDSSGRLFAAANVGDPNVSLSALTSDGRVIYGGCTDGSIRMWVVESGGGMREIHRVPGVAAVGGVDSGQVCAHAGAVSALSLQVRNASTAGASSAGSLSTLASSVSASSSKTVTVLVSSALDGTIRLWIVGYSK